MSFKMLGPLEVRDGSEELTPSAPKLRTVLALLLTESNQTVSTDALMDELWGLQRPPSATTTLQTYIFQLRQRLENVSWRHDHGHSVLETQLNGYRLVVPEDSLDTRTFEDLARAGWEAMSGGHPEHASELLDDALLSWRGPALIDVATGPRLELTARRLEGARLSALEIRIEADLQLGRCRCVVAELVALTMLHPLNESLHALLMTALHHSGRRADALAVYQRIRVNLVDELGLEPNATLQRTQHHVLTTTDEPSPAAVSVAA
jgi:DNA-binding SARP family transcriptional activator